MAYANVGGEFHFSVAVIKSIIIFETVDQVSTKFGADIVFLREVV